MALEQFILDFVNQGKFTYQSLLRLKRGLAKENKKNLVRHSVILQAYKNLVAKKKIKPNKNFAELLRLKKIRTLSGVSPVAVLTKPFPCPGECIYCPTQKNMPKSYLSDEPAVMRARECGFDAYRQVKRRIEQYEITGHQPQKIELIVMGGTWSVLPKDYKIKFISDCFRACNQISKIQSYNVKLKALKDAQKENETTKYRIIGLTLETRPDYINPEEIKLMRDLGCTRVELGVQSIYDNVLAKVKRGHTVQATVKATKLLKDAGFKICYHLMPNLPDSNLAKDLQMFKTIFTDERFCPDMIKIYPCVVTRQAKLYDWYKQGKFKPYTDQELIDLLVKIKKITPEWVRINRLGRDIPVANIAAGNKLSNIRQMLKVKCQCIRCREIKSSPLKANSYQLKALNYAASAGQEYFLQYVDPQNRLYALLRLRLTDKLAIVRELHTFGQALAIKSSDKKIQHQGLGKKLLAKAEEIARQKGFKKLSVISGIGARDYYRKLNYKLQNSYMVKYL